jgi:hypothetical protein
MTGSGSIRRRVPPGAGFGASSRFLAQYTTIHQMMMVARVATWNLQWQVKGFSEAMPAVDSRTLLGRFVDGSDVEGIDLRASVVDTPWDVLDQQTCQLLLINTVALYEAWCSDLCGTFQKFGVITEPRLRSLPDLLQWPDKYGARPRAGIQSAINELRSADEVSAAMTALTSAARLFNVDETTFSPRMRIYRVFKEARNTIAHRGGIAGDYLCEAYSDSREIKVDDLAMRIVPNFVPPVRGTPVRLSWRGVIGLSDMLRRMVSDIDHLLMDTKAAERDLVERMRTDPGAIPEPARSNELAKGKYWAKLPDGPWVVYRAQLERGQDAIYSAVTRLLNMPKAGREDFLILWPELLAADAVEIRSSPRDL